MAKWTKRNNPHTWSGGKMAKTATRTQIIRMPAAHAAPIIRVSAPRAAPKKHHHRRKHGDGGALTQSRLFSVAIGGAIVGYLEKTIGPQLPTIPLLGKKGTLAIGLYMFGKGKGGMVRDATIAAAVLAGYDLGSKGTISGDVDGSVQPQVSGIAAQV